MSGVSSDTSFEIVNQSDDLCENARTELLVKLKTETPNSDKDM